MTFLWIDRAKKQFWLAFKDFFPRRYWAADLALTRRIYGPLLRKAANDRDAWNRLAGELQAESAEAEEHIRSIDSRRLVVRAQRLYIGLDEMPKPDGEPFHHYIGRFGDVAILHEITYNALGKAVIAAESLRNQERRAKVDLVVRALTAITGLVGALIGLIAIVKKK